MKSLHRFTRFAVYAVLVLTVEAILSSFPAIEQLTDQVRKCIESSLGQVPDTKQRDELDRFGYGLGLFVCMWSVLYFVSVVLDTPIVGNRSIRVGESEMLLRVAISALFSILAFGFFYRGDGILPDRGEITPALSIYFSAVTFSTLGYGDIKPADYFRVWAAFQALVGNLHLGLIVAVAYFRLQKAAEREAKAEPEAQAEPKADASPTSNRQAEAQSKPQTSEEASDQDGDEEREE